MTGIRESLTPRHAPKPNHRSSGMRAFRRAASRSASPPDRHLGPPRPGFCPNPQPPNQSFGFRECEPPGEPPALRPGKVGDLPCSRAPRLLGGDPRSAADGCGRGREQRTPPRTTESETVRRSFVNTELEWRACTPQRTGGTEQNRRGVPASRELAEGAGLLKVSSPLSSPGTERAERRFEIRRRGGSACPRRRSRKRLLVPVHFSDLRGRPRRRGLRSRPRIRALVSTNSGLPRGLPDLSDSRTRSISSCFCAAWTLRRHRA
jgi:hypothetical protein